MTSSEYLKCLSIRPPWSTLIACGLKPVENRKWYCKYRGQLLIHSSLRWDKEGAEWICDKFPELRGLINHSWHLKGYIIGFANMIDCVETHSSEWFSGPFGFVFSDPIEWLREKAIPYKGQLSIFNVPRDLVVSAGVAL